MGRAGSGSPLTPSPTTVQWPGKKVGGSAHPPASLSPTATAVRQAPGPARPLSRTVFIHSASLPASLGLTPGSSGCRRSEGLLRGLPNQVTQR